MKLKSNNQKPHTSFKSLDPASGYVSELPSTNPETSTNQCDSLGNAAFVWEILNLPKKESRQKNKSEFR